MPIATITPTKGTSTGQGHPQLLSRLDSLQGHLAGVRRMVSGGASYPELIQQVRALQGALYHIEELLVREGLQESLGQPPREAPQKTLQTLLSLLKVKT